MTILNNMIGMCDNNRRARVTQILLASLFLASHVSVRAAKLKSMQAGIGEEQ